MAIKSRNEGGTGETLTVGGRTRVITKKEADDHKKKVMSTKATKYNTYARNTPYSRAMGYDHYEPELGMTEQHSDWRQELDEKCWPGYEKKGMKTMFGKRYPNCVKKSKKKK